MSVAYDPINNNRAGYQRVDQFLGQVAKQQAAKGIASGNYAQAMSALAGVGDVQGVAGLQDRQAQQQAAQQQQQDTSLARQLAFTKQATSTLERALVDGQDPIAAFDSFAPAFTQLGVPPEQQQQYRAALAADPANFLATVKAATADQERKLEIQNLGGGYGVAIDKGTGQVVQEYRAPQQDYTLGQTRFSGATNAPVAQAERAPEYIQRDPTKELVELPGATAAGGAQPRGIRNNNPGNIEDGPFARSLPGYTGSDGRFATFSTPEAGVNAGAQLLGSYARRGLTTPAEIINRWAPPSDNNPTQAYAQYVADRLGIGINDPVPEGRRGEAFQAINEFENGTRGPSQGSAATGGPRVVSEAQAPRETPAAAAAAASRNFTQERQLRSEFGSNPAVKTLAQVRPQVQIIGRIAQQARDGKQVSAADDLALIFSFMKMLDPGSVVREGEFANAQNTAGIPERVVNAYNNALRGTRLTDRQRGEFFESATGVMQAYQNDYDTAVGRTRELATSYGLDADRIARPAATPGSGQPRVRFELSPQQQSWVSQNARAETGGQRRQSGSRENPRLLNPSTPEQSYNNVPAGAYFLGPDGVLRQKPRG